MAIGPDRVQPAVYEDTAGGGDPLDTGVYGNADPIDPQEDAIESCGHYFQDALNRDETVHIARDGNDLVFTDVNAGSNITLSTLAAGGAASVPVGNCLFVDAVNGNNGTAVSGRLDKPYLTITAALAAAVSGDLVYVLPGTYDETSLIIPDDVTLAGIDRVRCKIIHTVISNTTIVTMGANTSLENLSIEGGSNAFPAGGRTLVNFPASTSATSVARNLLLTGNAGAVTGVFVAGSATSTNNWVTVDHVDIKGSGVSNGLLGNSTGFFVARDCVCYGLVGSTVNAGIVEFQDCKLTGLTGFVISLGATAYVNQSTRWNSLTNSGTLASSGLYLHPPAGGDLAGVMPDPSVAAITETSGPSQLVIGAIADGELLTRSGATLVGTTASGVTGPGSSVDKGIVVWDGTTGATVADAGVRHYGSSAADPTTPTPAAGDSYYNTALAMPMTYDGTRTKWLSDETAEIPFNRSGNTGAGAYYRVGNRAMASNRGRTAEYDGTIVSISYTRNDVDAATFEVAANGSGIATLASAANTGSTVASNGNFVQGDVLSVRNQAGGNTTRHVIGVARLKWRVVGFVNAMSLGLDGVDERLYSSPANNCPIYDRLDTFSVSLWMKSSATTWGCMIGKQLNGSTYTGWGIFQNPSAGGKFFVAMFSILGSNTQGVRTQVGGFNDGNWHHVCVTYDGSSTAAGLTVYVDGSSEPLDIDTDTLTGSILTSETMSIGSRGSSTPGAFYNGRIDEVSMFGIELSALQVAELFNSGTPADVSTHSASGDLQAWYRLGDGADGAAASPPVNDVSGNGYDLEQSNLEAGDFAADVP